MAEGRKGRRGGALVWYQYHVPKVAPSFVDVLYRYRALSLSRFVTRGFLSDTLPSINRVLRYNSADKKKREGSLRSSPARRKDSSEEQCRSHPLPIQNA